MHEMRELIRETDLKLMSGTFVKETHADKGTRLEQHAHVYPHVSVVVRGAARLYAGGQYVGDYKAPAGLYIAAVMPHQFVILEDDTIILCVHDMDAEVV